jgi:hypothetical protein
VFKIYCRGRSRLLIIISSTVQNYFLQNSENYISETYPTLALTLCVVIGGYSLIEPPIFLFSKDYLIWILSGSLILFFCFYQKPFKHERLSRGSLINANIYRKTENDRKRKKRTVSLLIVALNILLHFRLFRNQLLEHKMDN